MIQPKYEWRMRFEDREGNLNLPQLPTDIEIYIKDNLTLQRIPVLVNRTTIVSINGKTCGCLQWLDTANLLIWSSFEIYRFTLFVERVTSVTASETALQSEQLCI